jgi:hypothetical protein
MPENYVPLFRPPYGQRRADAQGFFKAQGVQVALWDIDAQDDPASSRPPERATGADPDAAVASWRDQFQCETGWGENGDALADYATAQSGIGWEDCQNGFREKPERVSLKTAKARKHWAKGDFGRDFDAGGLPTLTGDGSPPSAIRHSEK